MERDDAQRRHDQLLAKADRTTFPAEAEAFRAGAARLAATHGLNEPAAPHWTDGLGWQEKARHVDDIWRVRDGDIYDAVIQMFTNMDATRVVRTVMTHGDNGATAVNVNITWR